MKTISIRLTTLVFLLLVSTSCQPARNQPSIPLPEKPPQIGSGVAFTCLLTAEGGVLCWGQGIDTDFSPNTFGKPITIQGLASDVTTIGVGWYHSCAVKTDGRAHCWGQNGYGQFGDGTTQDSFTPVEVQGLEEITAISAGASHTCALTTGGSVYCWGLNSSGQLGDGTMSDRHTPTKVIGLNDQVAHIAAGSVFTCSLLTDGEVLCWGEVGPALAADKGQPIQPTPAGIPGLKQNVVAIAAGDYHICALMSTGEVDCRGSIFSSEDPTLPPPFDASELTGTVLDLMAGADFNCALTLEGKVWCWGDNYFGQLGDPSLAASNPVNVPGLEGEVVHIGGGHYTACALISDGGVKCWGDSSFGQLGDGTARWK